ncbi:MAG: hypothetical protein Kow00128_12940 [Deltaproteobacteria bacterium]
MERQAPSAESSPAAPGTAGPSERPARRLAILPAAPTRESELSLAASGFPLAESSVTWIVNGWPLPGAAGPTLPPGMLERGDTVRAVALFDGQEIVSETILLENAPPRIRKIRFIPEILNPGDSIGVEAEAEDADGDPVTLEYSWTRNGEAAGDGNRLQGVLRKNDRFTVSVTPRDEWSRGRTVTLRRRIGNIPPAIPGVTEAAWADGRYSCRILAEDPDGDPLRYRLAEAPPGMIVDGEDGTIAWTPPEGFHGKVPVKVVVEDDSGGEASYSFSVEIVRKEIGKEG